MIDGLGISYKVAYSGTDVKNLVGHSEVPATLKDVAFLVENLTTGKFEFVYIILSPTQTLSVATIVSFSTNLPPSLVFNEKISLQGSTGVSMAG